MNVLPRHFQRFYDSDFFMPCRYDTIYNCIITPYSHIKQAVVWCWPVYVTYIGLDYITKLYKSINGYIRNPLASLSFIATQDSSGHCRQTHSAIGWSYYLYSVILDFLLIAYTFVFVLYAVDLSGRVEQWHKALDSSFLQTGTLKCILTTQIKIMFKIFLETVSRSHVTL